MHAVVSLAAVIFLKKRGEENMIYYTSDLHLGHENCIAMCNRPFSSVEEMDEQLIEAWNKRVHADDLVFILGDLIYKSALAPEEYLRRLKGKKYLVIGNHDRSWLDKVNLADYFIGWAPLNVMNTGRGKATLCHFPLIEHEGRFMIHGHLHANTDRKAWEYVRNDPRAYNAGVDVNGYKPVTFDELVANNEAFKAAHASDTVSAIRKGVNF